MFTKKFRDIFYLMPQTAILTYHDPFFK